MDQKEFKDMLDSNRICDLQALIADLNKRTVAIEEARAHEERELRRIVE